MAVNPTQKKRKPPTFQHLPRNRAAKLKQQWVQKAKIRSKWKAQRRKEGLVRPRIPTGEGHGESEEDKNDTSSDDEGESDIPEGVPEPQRPSKYKGKEKEIQRTIQPIPLYTRDGKHHQRQNGKESDLSHGNDNTPSQSKEQAQALRNLTRKAYSRSSLHNHKADLLHRRKEAVKGTQAQVHDTSASDSRGRNSARGGVRDRKIRGGQPDMKLRMSAMLAKIQRDFT